MLRHSLLLGIVLSVSFTQAACARTWTLMGGRSVEGDFVRVSGNQVVLKRGNKIFKQSLAFLSDEDKAWIESKKKIKRSQRWLKSDGKSVNGKFIRIEDGKVVVRSGGKMVKIDWKELSDKNKTWLSEVLTGFGREDELPADAPAVEKKPTDLVGPRAGRLGGSNFGPTFGPKGGGSGRTFEGFELEWENLQGKVIKAIFIKIENGIVYLKKDGKVVKVALTKLSRESRVRAEMEQRLNDHAKRTKAENEARLREFNSEEGKRRRREAAARARDNQVAGSGNGETGRRNPDGGGNPIDNARSSMDEINHSADAHARAAERQSARGAQSLHDNAMRLRPKPGMHRNNSSSRPAAPRQEQLFTKCMSCGHILSGAVKLGDKCPFCDVIFTDEVDDRGRVTKSLSKKERAKLAKEFNLKSNGVYLIIKGVLGLFIVFFFYARARG